MRKEIGAEKGVVTAKLVFSLIFIKGESLVVPTSCTNM